MSAFTKAMGWDKHPAELAEANAVAKTALTAVEAVVPAVTPIVAAAEAIGNSPTAPATPAPTTTVQTIEVAAGKIIAVVDPNLEAQVNQAIDNTMARLGLTFAEGFVTGMVDEELEKIIGAPAHSPTSATTTSS